MTAIQRLTLSGGGTRVLTEALKAGGIGAFKAESDEAACLLPLLDALGWRGGTRQIIEALPHVANSLSVEDLRNVLAELGYRTVYRNIRPGNHLDKRLLPCLYLSDEGNISVLKNLDDTGGVITFSGKRRGSYTIEASSLNGRLLLISDVPQPSTAQSGQKKQHHWLARTFRRFRPVLRTLMLQTLTLNLLGLAVPLFIMTVYDRVIAAGSTRILLPLAFGLLLAFIFEALLRLTRARMLSYVSARLEFIISTSVFRQILSLAASLTETAPLGGQVARLREFDSLRDLFTGMLATVLLELPFILIFIGIIALLGGWLALIPLAMITLFALIAIFIIPSLRRRVARAGRTRAERHAFLVETITNMRTIREAGVEWVWQDRFRELNAQAGMAQFTSGQLTILLQTLAQAVMLLAGLTTIGGGVLLVLDERLSVGGLIATMILVWRVLSPIQNLFLSLTRAEQIFGAIKQIDQLMRLPAETSMSNAPSVTRRWAGKVAFDRVSFRYSASAEPALLGVSFTVEPGKILAIVGANGAGKSTILRLLLGLYRPSAGLVTLDGLDMRQIDPAEARQTLAYVPQQGDLFHGTLAQNLRLSNPAARDEDLQQSLQMAGLWDEISGLPDGLETRIGDQSIRHWNAGFRQRLSLARAFVRDAPVILLDEPAQALDPVGDKALAAALEQLRGSRTVIMVSHRPSHIHLADEVLVLERGQKILAGTPHAVFKKIPHGNL